MSIIPLSSEARATLALKPFDPCGWYGRPVPEPNWLVPDLIPRGVVTMLSGDGGLGKSLLALQLMAAVTTGSPWLGIPVPRCKSVGFFCEDDLPEIQRRMARINEAEGIDFDVYEGMSVISRVSLDNALVEFDPIHKRLDPSALFGHLMNFCTEEGAELLVVDSLHDVFAGNENSRPEARQFINMLRSIAMETNGAVVLCAHPSVAGMNTGTGSSGSTAWNNAVRSRLYLTRADDDQDARALKTMKSNYAKSGGEIRMTWRDGVFVADQRGGGMVAHLDRRGQDKAAEEAFVKALRSHQLAGGSVSPKPSGSYAPVRLAAMELCRGYGKKALEAAMYRLIEQGVLKIEQVGPPSRRTEQLVFTDHGSGK